MPLVTVALELSNGLKETLYYPSSIVLKYIEEKDYYLKDFIKIAFESLNAAQEQVVKKYGHSCIGCFTNKMVQYLR
ncbi:MAG: hypothetical protein ACTSPQ_04930 [Candidatus Helarchaeota archaeon]